MNILLLKEELTFGAFMKEKLQEEKQWLEEELISEDQFRSMNAIKSGKIFSLYWELQFALYVGVLMLTTGIGILIYKYIGSVGHILAILLLLVGISFGCYYLISNSTGYSKDKVEAPNTYFDYVTLLTSLLAGLTITYIEVQFALFDAVWTYIPLFLLLVYFFTAYRFDHKGVLALAIISLCSFFGLNVQPDIMDLNSSFDGLVFSQAGILVGLSMAAIGLSTDYFKIKSHYKSIYMNFAAWLVLGSVLNVIFDDGSMSVYGLLGLVFSAASLVYAWFEKSTWFAVYGSIVAYIVITFFLFNSFDFDFIILALLYFMISPIAPIMLIVKFNKHFKK